MSYISDYKVGALSEEEYRLCANEENRRDRYERELEAKEYYDSFNNFDDERGDDNE